MKNTQYCIWACRLTKNGRRYSNNECFSTYCFDYEIDTIIKYLKEEYYKGYNFEYHIENSTDKINYYSYNKTEEGYINIGHCGGFHKTMYIFFTEEYYNNLGKGC